MEQHPLHPNEQAVFGSDATRHAPPDYANGWRPVQPPPWPSGNKVDLSVTAVNQVVLCFSTGRLGIHPTIPGLIDFQPHHVVYIIDTTTASH